jgi:hypothetical protein
MPHRNIASQRAALLAQRHARAQTLFPHDNPSSTMYELLTAIEHRSDVDSRPEQG